MRMTVNKYPYPKIRWTIKDASVVKDSDHHNPINVSQLYVCRTLVIRWKAGIEIWCNACRASSPHEPGWGWNGPDWFVTQTATSFASAFVLIFDCYHWHSTRVASSSSIPSDRVTVCRWWLASCRDNVMNRNASSTIIIWAAWATLVVHWEG